MSDSRSGVIVVVPARRHREANPHEDKAEREAGDEEEAEERLDDEPGEQQSDPDARVEGCRLRSVEWKHADHRGCYARGLESDAAAPAERRLAEGAQLGNQERRAQPHAADAQRGAALLGQALGRGATLGLGRFALCVWLAATLAGEVEYERGEDGRSEREGSLRADTSRRGGRGSASPERERGGSRVRLQPDDLGRLRVGSESERPESSSTPRRGSSAESTV